MLAAAAIVLAICVERIGGRRNGIALWTKYFSIRIERTFLHNFRYREVRANARRPGYENTLRRHDVHLSQLSLPEGSMWGGRTLQELNFGHRDGVMIAAVIRGEGRINIPDGHTMLFPGDKLEVLGDDESLDALARRMNTEVSELTPNDQPHRLILDRMRIGISSPFAGKSLSMSGIRDRYGCMVVGFETKDEGNDALELATADRNIVAGDVLWIVGEEHNIRSLVQP